MAIKVTEIKHNYMYSRYFLPLTFSYFISSPKTNSQRLKYLVKTDFNRESFNGRQLL